MRTTLSARIAAILLAVGLSAALAAPQPATAAPLTMDVHLPQDRDADARAVVKSQELLADVPRWYRDRHAVGARIRPRLRNGAPIASAPRQVWRRGSLNAERTVSVERDGDRCVRLVRDRVVGERFVRRDVELLVSVDWPDGARIWLATLSAQAEALVGRDAGRRATQELASTWGDLWKNYLTEIPTPEGTVSINVNDLKTLYALGEWLDRHAALKASVQAMQRDVAKIERLLRAPPAQVFGVRDGPLEQAEVTKTEARTEIPCDQASPPQTAAYPVDPGALDRIARAADAPEDERDLSFLTGQGLGWAGRWETSLTELEISRGAGGLAITVKPNDFVARMGGQIRVTGATATTLSGAFELGRTREKGTFRVTRTGDNFSGTIWTTRADGVSRTRKWHGFRVY